MGQFRAMQVAVRSVWLVSLLFAFRPCGAGESDAAPAATSFAATVKQLEELVASSPYGEALTMDHSMECLVHFTNTVLPSCFGSDFSFDDVDGDILGNLVDMQSCCASLNAAIDEGMCLCEPRTSMGGALEEARPLLAFATLCGAKFPIPADVDDLPTVLELDQCQEFVAASTRGVSNPEAIGMTREEYEATKPEELPKFGDIYQKPEGGVYNVAKLMVKVKRPIKSTLVNKFSTPTRFVADLVIPTRLIKGGAAADRSFPVVGFVPGFRAMPIHHIRTMEYIASLGFIVVSPRSTFHADIDLSKENVRDWALDPVHAVKHVIRMGKRRRSTLAGRVAKGKVAFVGHSMGGAASLVAAQKGQKAGLAVKGAVAIAPACLVMGSQCESPYRSIPKLKDIDVLFIVGSEDMLNPTRTSRIFKSWLGNSTRSELIEMEGATHCFSEVDPVTWPTSNSECGKGTVAPQEAIRRMQIDVGEFLKRVFSSGT